MSISYLEKVFKNNLTKATHQIKLEIFRRQEALASNVGEPDLKDKAFEFNDYPKMGVGAGFF